MAEFEEMIAVERFNERFNDLCAVVDTVIEIREPFYGEKITPDERARFIYETVALAIVQDSREAGNHVIRGAFLDAEREWFSRSYSHWGLH